MKRKQPDKPLIPVRVYQKPLPLYIQKWREDYAIQNDRLELLEEDDTVNQVVGE